MKFFEKVCTVCVSVIITAFFMWFLSNDIFSGEDIVFSSLTNENISCNLNSFFTFFLPKIFVEYLPGLLHINPHEFSMIPGAFIRSFNLTMLFFIMTLFAFAGRKKNISFPFIMLISSLYFCYASSNIDFDIINTNLLPKYDLEGSFVLLTEYCLHFGQFIPFILGLFGIYFIISHFIQNKIPTDKNLYLMLAVALFISVSSLFACIFTGIVLLLVTLYLLFLKNFQNVKIFASTIIIYCFGAGFLFINSGFLKIFSFNPELIFLKTTVKTLLSSNSIEFALIIILSSVLYFLALNKTTYIKRVIFAVFSVIFSLFSYLSLYLYYQSKIILSFTEFQIFVRIVLFSLVLLLFSACMKELVNEKRTQKVIKIVLSLILLTFTIVQIPFTYTAMRLWRISGEETKITTYCLEKIYRFYSLQGKTALFPEDSLMKIYRISNFIEDSNIDKNEEINSSMFFKATPFVHYYTKYYKNSKVIPYKFINSKTALKIFFEEGGIINEEEIKHLNFQKLYDDKFVLNRALIKAKYDE